MSSAAGDSNGQECDPSSAKPKSKVSWLSSTGGVEGLESAAGNSQVSLRTQ